MRVFKEYVKVINVLVCVSCGVFMSASALAGSGSAIIPHVEARDNGGNNRINCYVKISNISNETVSVAVTFYNAGGAIAGDTDDNPGGGHIHASYEFLNYDDTHLDKSVTFDLAAHKTMVLTLKSDSNGLHSTLNGYGVIKWEAANVNSVALISHVNIDDFLRDSTKQSKGTRTVEVNNSLPF